MKYFVLVMLLSAGPVLADSETLLPLPDDVSVMGLGEITQEDRGSVTASDLAKTPAQPLPVEESVMELLQ